LAPGVPYARSGDAAIAYQVVGHGPMDIVFVRGITGDLLSTWDQPLLVRHVEGLAAFGRVPGTAPTLACPGRPDRGTVQGSWGRICWASLRLDVFSSSPVFSIPRS
jgi:hypothetical protein